MRVQVVGQLLLAHDPRALAHQVFEHAVLISRQVHHLAIEPGDLGREIHCDRPQCEHIGRGFQRTSQQRLDARGQLGVLERLDQIVVRARFQSHNLVLPAAARREDQDRNRSAIGPQTLHDRQAVQLGQSQVDDGKIDRIFARLEQAVLTVRSLVDAVPVSLELASQPESQGRIILDQQQAHADPPCESA